MSWILGFRGFTVIPLVEGRDPRSLAEANLSIPCELDGLRSVVMLLCQNHESRLLARRELSRNAGLGAANRDSCGGGHRFVRVRP